MNADTPATELDRVAALVRRLRPDWRNSEDFYELRSEALGALTALGRRLGVLVPLPVPPTPRPVTKVVTAYISGFNRQCPGCGDAFHTVHAGQVHCSGRCRMRTHRQRRRACA
jgi:hypothetical protein